MRGARSSKNWWVALASGAAMATVFTFMIPVFGAEIPDVDRLRLTDSVDAFFHGSAVYSSADEKQPITPSSDCQISPTTGSLVTLTSSGAGAKGPGIFDHGIGVKSGGANGTPCSQTEGKESLSITSKFAWHKLRLDVEAKGNAWIYVDLTGPGGVSQRHQLLTGSAIATYNSTNPDETAAPGYPYTATTSSGDRVAACANPNDSGPDSNINDNCLWTIEAGAAFTKVTISVKQGSVSLEGGNDYAGFDSTGSAMGKYDSLFYRIGAPSAGDDGYETDEDTTLIVAAPGVLVNDSDPLGSALTAILGSGPSSGTLALNANGSFSYTPDADFNGTDSFTYTATAGGEASSAATVTIEVNPVNDPPTLLGAALSATEDNSETFTGSQLATDADGDTLTITSAVAGNGAVTLNGDGSISYSPDPDSCLQDNLNFTVSDGPSDVSGSVPINISCVNDPPVAVDDLLDEMGDPLYEVNERVDADTSDLLTVGSPGVLWNDTDVEDPTSLMAVGGSPTTAEGATVTLNDDGSFTYVPSPKDDAAWDLIGAFSYVDTWDYTVEDPDGGTDVGTVSVTVHRVICSGEEVGAEDEGISGSFTLLPDSEGETPCKRYEVYADADDPGGASVTLVVPPDQGVPVFFRGLLTFDPVTLDSEGTFSLGIEYDPDNEGPADPKTLQVCLDPVYDAEGLIESAALPTGETWCLGGALTLASDDVDGELVTVFQVYGTEDPKFVFK